MESLTRAWEQAMFFNGANSNRRVDLKNGFLSRFIHKVSATKDLAR